MAQENNDADTAPVPATETSLLQVALVSGSQGGRCGLPSVPLVPLVSKPKLVSQSQEGPSEASIATLTPHSNEDGDDTGQQISLDAETTIAEAAKPKKGRGRPPKNADKKGTRGRPRKHVAQGPPSSSTAGQSSQPGLRKRGRPRKGTEPETAPEDKPKRRPRPDRSEKTSDHRGSIHDGALVPSASTGQRTADVFNEGSKYNAGYQASRHARRASLAMNQEEEQVLEDDVDCVYRGPLADGKSHGKGSVEWKNGDVYEGDFRNGCRTGKGKLTFSDGAVYVGSFFRGEMMEGKFTYPDGGCFEGPFNFGGRDESWYASGNPAPLGKLTYPDGSVFEGKCTWYDLNDESSAPIMGLLTFTSDDDRLDFDGDILALDPDFNRSERRGKMRWKDGTSYDGSWVAGKFVHGGLRCREFLTRYPLAFNEFWHCSDYNESKEGRYSGNFKDGKFHGWGHITWFEKGRSGRSYDVQSGSVGGDFKDGKLNGHCHWRKQSFFIRRWDAAEIMFRGTAAGGFIWPHVPSVPVSEDNWRARWDWPRPPLTGLRFKLDSKVIVNVGNDEWETGYIKGFTTDECNEATGYRVLLELDCFTVHEVTDDNDDFIREVVTDFEVGMELHPYFGSFVLYYSGPIVDGKPSGVGVLSVKYSKYTNNRFGTFKGPAHLVHKWPPAAYDWERDCEVEFGLNRLDYAVRGASRVYVLNGCEDDLAGSPFFDDPPRQLHWSTISLYDKSNKEDWHPLFGLIGSVLWNELRSDVAALKEQFAEETIAPVLWCDVTFSGQEAHYSRSSPGTIPRL